MDPRLSREWARTLRRRQGRLSLAAQEALLAPLVPAGYLGSAATLMGPVRLRIGREFVDLNRRTSSTAFELPRNCDALEFRSGGARGILFVHEPYLARQLHSIGFAHRARLLVLWSGGVPRSDVRRFLRRLAVEGNLPVHFIASSEPRAYFVYSGLRRGALLPHARSRNASLAEVRYLGLRATDHILLSPRRPGLYLLRGERESRAQIALLRTYGCFRSPSWQAEFDRYDARRTDSDSPSRLETMALIAAWGVKKLARFLTERIDGEDWLS